MDDRSGIIDAIVGDDPPAPCAALFPTIRHSTYLDTGSSGLSFVGQGQAAAAFYDEAKILGYSGRELWQGKAAAVRARLGRLLSVAPAAIEFFSGTTHGLNLVGHSIAWRRGDEVVVADDDFPSVRLAWQGVERAGGRIRAVAIPDEARRTEILAASVDERTRVLATAHVQSASGTRVDLAALGRACRAQDALLVVDGIHALGAVPVDLEWVDVYGAGVFKWLLGGFGLSVFVRNARARAAMQSAFRGYLNEPSPHDLQYAHVNYPGLYALDAALRLLEEDIGWAVVQGRTAALVGWLSDALAAGGIPLQAPAGARGGNASFAVPDSEGLKAALAERKIFVAAKGPWLRATPYFYNSREDVMRLARDVLRAVNR